eukprot:CAMPEP_0184505074 /NCGR_PEP_ID=MMETSP0113_2-20130426/52797_1 /TAXON_ID=91329 /ORGANISM="Norrisiella sphaerica, Strain BC52" /LENGTH=293 /DNA_ID=CAMNT_0026894745 /DNA_START=365 /DNA_END=1246 /DNA_ORIENTATION=+
MLRKFQAKASQEQMELYKKSASHHATHPPEVELAAKAAKKKGSAEKASNPARAPSQAAKEGNASEEKKEKAEGEGALSDVCCRPVEEVAAAARASAASLDDSLLAKKTNLPPDFQISVAVLTVSDRAHDGVYSDESGPAIENAIKQYAAASNLKLLLTARKVVRDDVKEISRSIKAWTDNEGGVSSKESNATHHGHESPGLILTTGGTGFSNRDVTPEATKLVCERLATTLAASITLQSSRNEPFALLSRAAAGIRKKSVIFNLPGRPKAVKENLRIALPQLLKAVYELRNAD